MASTTRGMLARRQRGFIYMALVVFFGIFAIFAASAMITGGMLQRRTGDEQLLYVGTEFRNALQSYCATSLQLQPDKPPYPAKLEDLLEDTRVTPPRRHLRQIYRDPLTGQANWATVAAPGGGIMGVHSLSPAKAVKLFAFPPEFKHLEGKPRIADWVFSYDLPAGLIPAPATAGNPPATAAAPVIPAPAAPVDAPPASPVPAAPVSPAAPAAPAAPTSPATPAKPTPDELKLEELLKELNKRLEAG